MKHPQYLIGLESLAWIRPGTAIVRSPFQPALIDKYLALSSHPESLLHLTLNASYLGRFDVVRYGMKHLTIPDIERIASIVAMNAAKLSDVDTFDLAIEYADSATVTPLALNGAINSEDEHMIHHVADVLAIPLDDVLELAIEMNNQNVIEMLNEAIP